MKNVVYNILVVLVFVSDLRAAAPYLVKNGKTDFQIVLPDMPQPVEQTAAMELKTYLDTITGINWRIALEKDVAENAPQILVGNSARAKKIFPEIDPEKIPYDGLEIHLKKNKLLLTGHHQRGTLYAVNTFLEDVLGVRWWTSTEQTIPKYKTFRLKPLKISYAPKLIYREASYKDALDPVFATRMKCNGHWTRIVPEYGGHHHIVHWCHSFFLLIPPEKYFADHPEWFSEIDGIRKHERAQLCLTNDEMRQELTKNAIESLRTNPGARFISISQNDWTGFCTCEKCNKVVEEEDSQSGPIVRFVNAVAEDIEKEFPDVLVETLAYWYSRKPPRHVKPRHNVVIRLCTIECSFVQPLTGEQNQSFRDDMEGWSKIAQQLFVWDYVTNFWSYILPHPNLRVLAPNIRFFVDRGTIGLFEQGDTYCTVSDFVRMRNWLISKLMWNPTLDEKELMRKYIIGYYGSEKLYKLLMDYFDTLHNKAESTDKHIGCYNENTDDWLDYETLCKATAIFNQAIDVAERQHGKDSEYVQRLRRERLSLEHVWLKGYYKFKRIAEAKGEKFHGPADPMEAYKDFFAVCEKYNVTHYREYKSFAEYRENMFYRFGKSAPEPEEFSNLDRNKWMDIQEYEFQTTIINNLASFVDDAAASNGRAVRMPGNHNEWATLIYIDTDNPLFNNMDANSKFRIVAYVRCDATAKDGTAMNLGIFDQKEGKGVAQQKLDVSEIVGSEYKKIEFEPLPLSQTMYIWFAPPKREGEVHAVYIDRVLIIRE